MARITKLTQEQEARFPEFIKKWVDIGLSTAPADREKAERAIAGLYKLANLRESRVIWLPCPISAALSAVVYATLIAKRIVAAPTNGDSHLHSSGKLAVDSAVDSAVRSAVGSAVDSAVDSAVHQKIWWHYWYGGQFWAAWAAFTSYFVEV
ncbi:MAG: hypothetical protein ACRD3E_15845, partial [Terriglobales bacterium]